MQIYDQNWQGSASLVQHNLHNMFIILAHKDDQFAVHIFKGENEIKLTSTFTLIVVPWLP